MSRVRPLKAATPRLWGPMRVRPLKAPPPPLWGSLRVSSIKATNAVAVGREAGQTSQGARAVAIGYQAGLTSQGDSAIAVGYLAGQTSQGGSAVAVGDQAGVTSQGDNAIAVGSAAGRYNQANYTVALGYFAGETNQHANSIVLNASGSALNTAQASSFYVKPVRGGDIAASALAYTSAGEIVEETGMNFDASGNVGIGTASPKYTLDVIGGARVTEGFEFGGITSELPQDQLQYNSPTTTIVGHGDYTIVIHHGTNLIRLIW
jgi:hypothetical protein